MTLERYVDLPGNPAHRARVYPNLMFFILHLMHKIATTRLPIMLHVSTAVPGVLYVQALTVSLGTITTERDVIAVSSSRIYTAA